jgi:hypothetical protein
MVISYNNFSNLQGQFTLLKPYPWHIQKDNGANDWGSKQNLGFWETGFTGWTEVLYGI